MPARTIEIVKTKAAHRPNNDLKSLSSIEYFFNLQTYLNPCHASQYFYVLNPLGIGGRQLLVAEREFEILTVNIA